MAQPFQYLPGEPGMESLYWAQQDRVPQTGYIPSEPGMEGLRPPPVGPVMDFSGAKPSGGFTIPRPPMGRDPNANLGIGGRMLRGSAQPLDPRQQALLRLMDLAQKRGPNVQVPGNIAQPLGAHAGATMDPVFRAQLDEQRRKLIENYMRQSQMAAQGGTFSDLESRGLLAPDESAWII